MNLDVPYGITRRIAGADLQTARTRITNALKEQGFGVLTEIDVAATLEQKIGAKIDPYVILGACNPKLAHRAIGTEPAIGLLLPCNVVLAQDGADTLVSAASPKAMFAIVQNPPPELSAVAEEAETKLRAAVAAA
ncbi:MAG TPA: DUF302 domain-containing protein [Polyangiaceae bacterium]|nr:DUF302 domain-containing protein [Polyangiaceae bacterium]